jgi:hypothetical protein
MLAWPQLLLLLLLHLSLLLVVRQLQLRRW